MQTPWSPTFPLKLPSLVYQITQKNNQLQTTNEGLELLSAISMPILSPFSPTHWKQSCQGHFHAGALHGHFSVLS